jgi:hypothetical protein
MLAAAIRSGWDVRAIKAVEQMPPGRVTTANAAA